MIPELPIISVNGISKKYSAPLDSVEEKGLVNTLFLPFKLIKGDYFRNGEAGNEIWALKDLHFDIYRGEKVGIIGRNGAGKTTLLKILSRITYPTGGDAIIRGRVTSLLEVGTGFNANLTGKENIMINASIHGLKPHEIDAISGDIEEFSGVKEYINMPVKFYSKGMYMRLAFAVAAHLNPDILMLDEVLAVGDMAFQQKCLSRVKEMSSSGRTILMVSHSMGNINRFCDKCIWLEDGKIFMSGTAKEVTAAYTEKMLDINSSVRLEAFQDVDTDTPFDDKDKKENLQKTEKIKTFPKENSCARLLHARIIDKDHNNQTVLPIDKPIGIEFSYEVFDCRNKMVPGFALIDDEERVVFWAVDGNPSHHKEIEKSGVHLSVAWIPDNFLNEGNYHINLTLASPDTAPQIRHFYYEKIMAFYATEAKDPTHTARGIMPRSFPGIIRPKLQWEYNKK